MNPMNPYRSFDAVLRSDFPSFLRKCFPGVSPGDTLLWNWHHDAIAHHLQQVYAGQIQRLVVNIPPRNLKSILISVAFVAWSLGRNPQLKFICVSYSQNLADLHGRLCLEIIQSDWYQRIFPGTRLDRRKCAPSHFMTTAGGYRYATSVEGTLTGVGADIIIIDDPIKADGGGSEAERTRANKWFDTTLLTRLNDKNTGRIIIVMQRLHIDDLTGHLLESGAWTHLSLPAIAVTSTQVPIGPGRAYLFEAGEVLHPARESRAILDDLQVRMGTNNFSAQYLQEPVPIQGNLVRRHWFGAYLYEPVRCDDDQVVISWDTASKASEISDYSVATVWLKRSLPHGKQYYLLDVVRERLEYPDLRRKIIELRRQWNAGTVLIEDTASGQALLQDLNREGLGAIGVQVEGDKVIRFRSQTAVIEQGRVFLPDRAQWLETYLQELMQFPGGRHDDQVDSTSQFLKWAESDHRYEFW